jgi:acyl-CoA synthetase (AMP-forming)/AMP-acid ligase II
LIRNFVDLIEGLQHSDPTKGILLVNSRFQESFHSYADLFRRTQALAGEFRAQGIRQGQRVLTLLGTDIDAIGSFLALVRLGAVPLSVPAPLIGQDREAYRRQIVRLICLHRVDRLVVSEELAGIAGAYAEAPGEMALRFRAPTVEEAAAAGSVEPAAVAPEDIAFVQFSSGSTSNPKGVKITHRSLLHNIGVILDNDLRTPDSVFVSWLPLYHDMGFVGGLLTNFVHRNALVLMHPRCFVARPIVWLEAITRHRATVTAIPNFALDVCTERVTEEQLRERVLDLSTLRYIYNGSEPVRVASIRRFEEKFVRHGFVPGSIYPVYGMAEATLIITAPHRDEPEIVRRIEGMEVPSVGYPLGDFEVQIRDDDGVLLGREHIGEIHVRGTSVTPGYLEGAGASHDVIRDGWLATGDLGLVDQESRLYITGRKKDLLIVQGRNFYGHDIAACVEEGLGLRAGSAYVFSIDREGQEAVIVMLALPKPSEDEAMEGGGRAVERFRVDVQELVHREFGIAVHDVHLVPRIPKTTSGKIIRHVCQQMYLQSKG